MQIKFHHTPSASDIDTALYKWFELLADEKYDDAYNYTAQHPYYNWSPKLLEEVINGYGLPVKNKKGDTYKVSDWKTAWFEILRPKNEITFNSEDQEHWNNKYKIIGNVFCYLPLNGKWSDLSATFSILKAHSYVTLELNEIHVF